MPAASYTQQQQQWRERLAAEAAAQKLRPPLIDNSQGAKYFENIRWNKSGQRVISPNHKFDPRYSYAAYPRSRPLNCTFSSGQLLGGASIQSPPTSTQQRDAFPAVPSASSNKSSSSAARGSGLVSSQSQPALRQGRSTSAYDIPTISYSPWECEGWGTRHVQNKRFRPQVSAMGFQLHSELLGYGK